MVVYDAISIAEVTDKPTERETNLSLSNVDVDVLSWSRSVALRLRIAPVTTDRLGFTVSPIPAVLLLGWYPWQSPQL